jgi:hypothetical protein
MKGRRKKRKKNEVADKMDLFFFLLERKVSRVLSLYRGRAKEKKTCWDSLEKTSFFKTLNSGYCECTAE